MHATQQAAINERKPQNSLAWIITRQAAEAQKFGRDLADTERYQKPTIGYVEYPIAIGEVLNNLSIRRKRPAV